MNIYTDPTFTKDPEEIKDYEKALDMSDYSLICTNCRQSRGSHTSAFCRPGNINIFDHGKLNPKTYIGWFNHPVSNNSCKEDCCRAK